MFHCTKLGDSLANLIQAFYDALAAYNMHRRSIPRRLSQGMSLQHISFRKFEPVPAPPSSLLTITQCPRQPVHHHHRHMLLRLRAWEGCQDDEGRASETTMRMRPCKHKKLSVSRPRCYDHFIITTISPSSYWSPIQYRLHHLSLATVTHYTLYGNYHHIRPTARRKTRRLILAVSSVFSSLVCDASKTEYAVFSKLDTMLWSFLSKGQRP